MQKLQEPSGLNCLACGDWEEMLAVSVIVGGWRVLVGSVEVVLQSVIKAVLSCM